MNRKKFFKFLRYGIFYLLGFLTPIIVLLLSITIEVIFFNWINFSFNGNIEPLIAFEAFLCIFCGPINSYAMGLPAKRTFLKGAILFSQYALVLIAIIQFATTPRGMVDSGVPPLDTTLPILGVFLAGALAGAYIGATNPLQQFLYHRQNSKPLD